MIQWEEGLMRTYTVVHCSECKEYKGVARCPACGAAYCEFCETSEVEPMEGHFYSIVASTFNVGNIQVPLRVESLRTWKEVEVVRCQ